MNRAGVDTMINHNHFKARLLYSNAFARILVILLASAATRGAGQTAQVDSGSDTVQPHTVKLTLPAAIQMALEHNRQLSLARLATEENKEKRNAVRADYFPHIRNESTAIYLTDLQGVVIPAGALGASASTGPIPGATIRIGQGAQSAFTSGTGLAQPLSQAFKIHAGVKAADADVKSSEIALQDAEDGVALLVRKMFFDLLIAKEQLTAAEAGERARQKIDQETAQDVAQGRALDATALESHVAYLDQEQVVLSSQLSIEDLSRQLNDILGLAHETKLLLDSEGMDQLPPLPSREEMLSAAHAENPKILAAQQAIEKAKAGLAAARADYIPDISGVARYSYQNGVPFLVHNFGSFGGLVSFDLFDGGAREAHVKQARIAVEMAETQLSQVKAEIDLRVDSGYSRVRQLSDLVNVETEALKAREEMARVADKRLGESSELPSSMELAHAAVESARAALLEANLTLLLAEEDLVQLMGRRP